MSVNRFRESGVGSGVSHRTGAVRGGVLYGQQSATQAGTATHVECTDADLAGVRCVSSVLFDKHSSCHNLLFFII